MKPPSDPPEAFGPEAFDDAALDALFAQARQPTPQDLGAAQRFLSRQKLSLLDESLPTQTLPTGTPPAALPERRLARPLRWWTPLLAAAALFGGVLVLRPAPVPPVQPTTSQPVLASSAAYDAYTSALGGEW